MRGITPALAAQICGGELIGGEDIKDREISFITRDSREAGEGCMFAAIPGARTDGHDHLESARERGALCALCQRSPAPTSLPYILAGDTQRALGRIAAYYRQQFDIPVIGITGSVGKTSTKEMTASVLSQRFKTLKTAGNYNNELGVPLTLFGLDDGCEAAVVEMGISGFGEMERLTDMVRPDIAVISCVGYSHLQGLGGLDGVLRAKTAISLGMPENGTLVLNGDDELLRSYKTPLRTVYYGLGEDCAVRAKNVRALGLDGMELELCCRGRSFPVRINAFGDHLVYAALAAAAVGAELGLSDSEIAAGIAAYSTVGRRSSVLETGGMVIIDDCYNSNPNSAMSALRSLSLLGPRRVCILGDMLELGEDSAALHAKVGEFAAECADLVVTQGAEAAHIHEAASKRCEALHFAEKSELLANLHNIVRPGDRVLVKASRGMHFEDVTEALKSW